MSLVVRIGLIMISLSNLHAPLVSTSLALMLLAACTPAASEEDEGETGSETGESGNPVDQEACVDPGTELLDNVRPALLPTDPPDLMYTCTTGWGTDAPHVDPEWTKQIGDESIDYNFTQPAVVAHPDGGVVVAGMNELSHYAPDGTQEWTMAVGAAEQHYFAVEEAGTLLIAYSDYNTGESALTRYDGAGQSLGEVVIPWNSDQPSIWAVRTFGTDIVIGGNDQDAQGNWESTLIRIDVDGNLLLRKSTNTTSGNVLVVNDSGVAIFGTFPGFIVSLDNGEVLGMLTPSMGGVVNMVASGDDFYMAGNFTGTSQDFGVGRYDAVGIEQWLQGYDRATLNDVARGIAVGPDGNLVAVGVTSLLNFQNAYWYNTQPLVFGVDSDGNALWSDRIAGHGEATAVAVGVDGDVYVAGLGDATEVDTSPDEPHMVVWLRRYQP